MGLEEYILHNYQPKVNEIMWEFYALLEPPITREVVTFTKHDIVVVILIKYILVEHCRLKK